MVFRFSSSESQEMGLSVFVFGKSGNGSFGIRLRKVGKWVFRYSSSESREMGFRCFDFGKRRTERSFRRIQLGKTKWNAGRLDDEFETNRMMETTGSGRLDNGNRNEPECRMKLRPGLW
ncbi:unnamed protein product [Rhizophagus irregularis]|nr:unnamed protein product [Rhizophagus irregularis]